MTDKEIIEALISHDGEVTQQFFFKDCRPLFTSIIRHVFPYEVDYDEFVNELYIHLMEDDAYKLKQFQGRSTLYQWMKVVAIRYFLAVRKRMTMIDDSSKEPLLENCIRKAEPECTEECTARMDIENLLVLMPNKRYVHVIRRLMIDEAETEDVAKELGTNVDNLYNIKRRAMSALTQVALKETCKHEK